jgi:hypothetical protein
MPLSDISYAKVSILILLSAYLKVIVELQMAGLNVNTPVLKTSSLGTSQRFAQLFIIKREIRC